MFKKSFRLRITLLTAAVSGLVLLVFIIVAASVLYQINFKRLDERLRLLSERALPLSHMPDRWPEFEEALQSVYAEENIIMAMKNGHGEVMLKSQEWPASLDMAAFPDPPPRPGRFRTERRDYQSEERGPPRRHGPGPGRIERSRPEGESQRPFHPRFEGERAQQMRPPPPRVQTEPDTLEFSTLELDGVQWRLLVVSYPGATIVVGFDMQRFSSEMNQSLRAVYIAFPIALFLIGVGSWVIANRAMKPIKKLTATARSLDVQQLDKRIESEGQIDEMGELVHVFNEMLDRLEKSFQHAVRFSADAAHELNTPLTILQGNLEGVLQSAESGSTLQQKCSMLLDETHRLKSIVRKLLLLSLADAGRLKLNYKQVNLSELLENLGEDARILNPEATITQHIQPKVTVEGDSDLLNQVLQNLISNALKYRSEGGAVEFELKQENGTIVCRVINDGATIDASDREAIFERFYRVDKARNREIEGTGLGLSLAREIARAHGGDLFVDANVKDRVAFVLSLKSSS